MLWVGVDIGGTFTDVVAHDTENGRVVVGKSPSIPDDPASAVMNALSALELDLGAVARFRHGATIATNTVLERNGAKLGVITTRGFRDVLIVGRGHRSDLYDIKATRPEGLVKRSAVIEVDERLGPGGEVLLPLDEAGVAAAARMLGKRGVDAVAICFLHSYANPAPEARAAEIVASVLPGTAISRSSEVLAEHREYQRFATTALNAYVAPVMSRYLRELEDRLGRAGLRAAPEIMTSSGGSWPFRRMARLPVNSMLSGPAGGVIGAVALAAELGEADLVSYDMGGTSTDVCLIREGRYGLQSEGEIGGLPNRAAQIEINSVGAGGGSIAYLDTGGFLNVGPRSAGAVPGPACYGRGGEEPTVTDANVVLGRFRPSTPLGGEIEISHQAAARAIEGLARRLGLDSPTTAEGIVRIAVTRMTGAIKEISVMRGLDPRSFTLFAFGGAGPLHAGLIAEELGMARVVVPPLSGAFSAHGLLVADSRRDLSHTRIMALEAVDLAAVRAMLAPMRETARAELAADGFAPEEMRFEEFVDLRYVGQAYELTTPLDPGMARIEELIEAFHRVYEQRYALRDAGPVEAVSFRLSAHGLTEKPPAPGLEGGGGTARLGDRCVRFGDEALETPVWRREALVAGTRLDGPAVIEEAGATTLVPPNFRLERHPSGALILTREAGP
ncbi:MAG: hydantoinase/oxoprolinase family protein [Alphaproteobacteria bacterium]